MLKAFNHITSVTLKVTVVEKYLFKFKKKNTNYVQYFDYFAFLVKDQTNYTGEHDSLPFLINNNI